MQCLGAIEMLHTLYLEADSVASLEYHTLYEPGSHIHVLRLLGGAASRSFVEVPDWKNFLSTLFETLSSLECFETTQDARQLVLSASMQTHQEVSEKSCKGLIVRQFWHLYVVVDMRSSALKGVLRSKDNIGLLQDMSVGLGDV